MIRQFSLQYFVLFSVALVGSRAHSVERSASDKQSGDRVVAIDVLLEPDAEMVGKAEAANAKLRANYPEGYTLGKEQVAHITLVHAYVREQDLRMLEAELSKLAEATQPLSWQLTATGYSHAIWAGIAITSIGVERTQQLDMFQENVQKAVNHFAVSDGTAAAFSTSHEQPKIDKEIVEYVKNFATKSSGKKYNPHVTIGVAHEDFVKRMQADVFDKFAFKSTGLAICRLGNFGTAQKKLWEWHPTAKPSTK